MSLAAHTRSNVVALPGSRPPAPEPLGTCNWCWAAEAVKRVEVTPAKQVRGKRELKENERAVEIPACPECAAKLERRLEERRREQEAEAERKRQAREAKRR